MANNLTAVISADTSGFVSAISEAKQSLDDWVKETKEATATGKEQSFVTQEQVTAYNKVLDKLAEVSDGTKSAKQQQAALKDQIKELTTQWYSLSDSAKESSFGTLMAESLGQAKQQLATLTENSNKAKEEVSIFFDSLKKNADSSKGSYKGLTEEGRRLAEVFHKPQGDIPLKKQLKLLQAELTTLTDKWRSLSEAEQQSAEGQELATYMDTLREKAGSLKDTIGDVSDEISVMASDTPNLDVFNQLLGLSADAMQTYSGIIAKVTGDEEALKDMLSTVIAVQGAANFATKLTNALQSSSVLMLKIRTIQEGAAATAIRIKAAAEGKSTLATRAATIAQAAFNAVANANPYVLLAAAIIGAVGIIYGFTKALGKNAEAQEAAKKKAEALKAKQEEQTRQTQELNEAAAETSTKFLLLKAQYEQLRTTAEKNQFIKDNANAFSNLGLSVDSVTDAERVFVNNTEAVLNALLQRAIAAKKADQIADQIVKLKSQKSTSTGDYRVQYEKSVGDLVDDRQFANGMSGRQILKAVGLDPSKDLYRDKNSVVHLYDSGIKKLKAFSEREAAQKKAEQNRQEAALTQGYKAQMASLASANNVLSKSTPVKHDNMYTRGGHTSTPPKKTAPPKQTPPKQDKTKTFDELVNDGKNERSVTGLKNIITQIQKQLEDGIITGDSVEKAKNHIRDLQKKLEEAEAKLVIEPILDLNSLSDIETTISKKQDELSKATTNEARAQLQTEIDVLSAKKQQIELYITPKVDENAVSDFQKQLQDLDTDTSEKKDTFNSTIKTGSKSEQAAEEQTFLSETLKEQLKTLKDIADSYKGQVDIVLKRKQMGAQLTTDEEKLLSIYDETKKKIDSISASYDNAAKSAKEMSNAQQLGELKFEGAKTAISTVGDLNNSISSVVSSWKNLLENTENQDSFENTVAVIDTVIGTLETAIRTYENISKVIEVFSQISQVAAQSKVQSNQLIASSEQQKAASTVAASTQIVASNASETASSTTLTTAKTGEAIAGATASGAKVPFPFNLIAIAAGIAAVIGAISMIGKFADGGIIQGTSVGDLNLARVNGGEMILNSSQQGRLFRLLNEGGTLQKDNVENKQVSFRISGNDLVGVLNNHRTRISKVL